MSLVTHESYMRGREDLWTPNALGSCKVGAAAEISGKRDASYDVRVSQGQRMGK